MTTQAVSQSDQNLWAAYGNKLKTTLMQSPTLGSDERIYIAPLSAVGIAAGKNIDTAITNFGVYNVGDSLLSLDSPVFMPTRNSYIQRMSLYCNSVYLNTDGNQGAQVRYNDAQDQATKAAARYMATVKAALADWKQMVSDGLTTETAPEWFASNAPQVAQAQNDVSAAAAALASASAAIKGNDAILVGQAASLLNSAITGSSAVPGVTMTCSSAAATQIQAGQAGTAPATFSEPAYMIANQYGANVDNWISTFDQNKSNPTTISFSASDATSNAWANLGFSSNSVSVSGSYCVFFTATYTENNQTVTKNLSTDELDSGMQVNITCTGVQAYPINPGKWNNDQVWSMPLKSSADASLRQPAASVIQAVLAYGVGVSITMNTNAASQIHNYMSKAQSSGGSCTIFGFDIGLGGSGSSTSTSTTTFDQVKSASSGTTINIPPSDNAYPTLLAVMGRALPSPPAPAGGS